MRKSPTRPERPLLKDATKPITLHITKADIRGSRKMDPDRCAAAVALKRELKCVEARVFLSKTYIRQDKDGPWERFATPESLSREITSFDRTSFFAPGEYRLVPVSPSVRLGAHPGGRKSKVHKSKKAPLHFTKNVRERAPRVPR